MTARPYAAGQDPAPQQALRLDIVEREDIARRFESVRQAYELGRIFGERALADLERHVAGALHELDDLARAVAEANVNSIEILERQEELTRHLDRQNRELVEQSARLESHRREQEAQLEAMAHANVDALLMMDESEGKLASLEEARRRLAERNRDLDERTRDLEREALALAESNTDAILMMEERERELIKLRDQNRDLREEQQSLQSQAFVDGLTGLYNHRYLREQLATEVARARRYDRALSVIFLDADHFKQINDNFGHDVGDTVLRAIARTLSSGIRGADIGVRMSGTPFAVRYGGEEFVLLLPETPLAGAVVVAERLRASIEAEGLLVEQGQHVTVSAGVATSLPTDDPITAVLRRADAALYRAKRAGRNRVEVCESEAT